MPLDKATYRQAGFVQRAEKSVALARQLGMPVVVTGGATTDAPAAIRRSAHHGAKNELRQNDLESWVSALLDYAHIEITPEGPILQVSTPISFELLCLLETLGADAADLEPDDDNEGFWV